MKSFIPFLLFSIFSAEAISMKDLSIDPDISDIKPNIEKPATVAPEIDLGPDPLNLPSKKTYDPGNRAFRPMLSPTELAKRQPAPETVGRYFPGY